MLAQFLIAATGGVIIDLNNIVLVYDTRLSAGTTIAVPLGAGVNCTIDWGDGTSDSYTTTGYKSHTYPIDDVYIVQISGTLTRLGISTATSPNTVEKLTECLSFGTVGLTSLEAAFRNCTKLTKVPSSLPTTVTSLKDMFWSCLDFNDSDIGSWNTTNITNMSGMFRLAFVFNQSISSWTMTNVTDISFMFLGANLFNQSLNSWNTINVTNMESVFDDATSFNSAINGWNTVNVTNMNNMFRFAQNFNQDINSWNTGSVTTMQAMFSGASDFNQYIGDWDTSSVVSTGMDEMFFGATNFNQNLTGWCVTDITSEPTDFSTDSALSSGNKPIWGTCP